MSAACPPITMYAIERLSSVWASCSSSRSNIQGLGPAQLEGLYRGAAIPNAHCPCVPVHRVQQREITHASKGQGHRPADYLQDGKALK
jgi:hypothetical protein